MPRQKKVFIAYNDIHECIGVYTSLEKAQIQIEWYKKTYCNCNHHFFEIVSSKLNVIGEIDSKYIS